MSGGGGGIIIIKRIAEGPPVTSEDRATLYEIADRSPVRCSRLDALRVLMLLWRYLR